MSNLMLTWGEVAHNWAPVFAALIAAFIAASGWFVAHRLSRAREDRTRRLELTIRLAERQIEEFYAPALVLIEELNNTFLIKESIASNTSTVDRERIDKFVYEEYFYPTHIRLSGLISSKVHLLDGIEIPKEITDYLRHANAENVSFRVHHELGVEANADVTRFPGNIRTKLKSDLKVINTRYENAVKEMRRGLLPDRD